jgi:hypothetical protein
MRDSASLYVEDVAERDSKVRLTGAALSKSSPSWPTRRLVLPVRSQNLRMRVSNASVLLRFIRQIVKGTV